jgi:uncharacterized protein
MSGGDDVVVLRAADYRRMRWKNGGGWTTELAVEPAGAAEFVWRVSVAEIDADCEFSRFPGIDRSILVLTGGGMALEVEGEAPAVLHAGGEALRFSGDLQAHCRLLGGPTRDFNVMSRRGVCEHSSTRHGLVATWTHPGDCEALVHLASGSARVGAVSLEAGDSVKITSAAGPVALVGAGELVVVQLRRG